MEKTFIADKRVKECKESGKTTPLNDPLYEVTYADNSTELLTKRYFETVKTFKAADLTGVRTKLVENVGSAVYGFLVEYDLKLEEVEAVLQEALRLANDGTQKAVNILWEQKTGKRIEYPVQRSILAANEILKNERQISHPDAGEQKW